MPDERLQDIAQRVEALRRSHPTLATELEALLSELRFARRDVNSSSDLLRESEARYAAIVETAVDGIITIDAGGVILGFNAAAETIFGYAAEEVIGGKVDVLMPEPHRSRHDGYIQAYLETGDAQIIGIGREVQGRRKDGSLFPLDLAVSEIAHGDGRMFTGIVRDITRRKQMEEALRRERDFAQRLIDTAPVMVLVLDPEGRILRVNEALTRLRGEDEGALIGAQAEGLGLLPSGTFRDLDAASAPMELRSRRFIDAAGEHHDVDWHMTWLRDAEDHPQGLLAVGQDITERLHAEAQIQELERAAQQRERLAEIGALTAKIVHDLGNPLAALSMNAQLLLRSARKMEASAVLRPAQQIVSEVDRLSRLVRGYTGFARDRRLELERVDMVETLRALIEFWRPVADEARVELELDAPEALEVRVDPHMLRRILDNLLKNAIESTEPHEGGHVALRLGHDPERGRFALEVQDDGVGIPTELDVFRLFVTDKPRGSGIGLPITRQLVLTHGGHIKHRPAEPRGTLFRIELPTRVT